MRTDLLKVLDHLRQEAGGLSDGQLLARFVAVRDGAAFEALVRRHGKMVYGVCFRVLRDAHDAEDVFQQAFLKLTRKAASVVKRESLGAWLYNVAFHAALDAAASRARRRRVEKQVEHAPHPVLVPAEPDDWRALLDVELNRLPEKYRSAVVLCDLEGRPRREAARQLGVPEGTLSSRLFTAHRMLAQRLSRYGLAVSAGAVTAALAKAAAGDWPSILIKSAAKAAMLPLTAGPLPALVLLKGVLHTMFISKWWPIAGALVVAVGLAGIGVGFGPGHKAGFAEAAPPKQESELEALKKEHELLKLNLQIVLEKFRALEAELEAVRGPKPGVTLNELSFDLRGLSKPALEKAALLEKLKAAEAAKDAALEKRAAEAAKAKVAGKAVPNKATGLEEEIILELELALKGLPDGKDNEMQMRILEAVEKAMKKVKDKNPK